MSETLPPSVTKRPRCVVSFEVEPDFRRSIKIYAAEHGTTLTSVFERGARLVMADAAPLTPAEAARAELLAIGEEFGIERAVAHLRAAQRARVTAA